MADQPWTDLGTPGDVIAVAVAAAAGAADVAVLTFAGELWWRRPSDAGWAWSLAGSPPATGFPGATATTVAALGPGADGAPTAAVGGPDMNLWIHRPAVEPAWTDLAGPMNNGGFLRPLRLPRGAGEHRSVLLASDGQPWIATLADPADPASADVLAPAPDLPQNWSMTGPAAYAGGSTVPGDPPQPHVVVAVNVHDVWESGVRVGFPDGAAWSWIDPGPLPPGVSTDVVDAVGVRAADGAWEVCAVFPALTDDGPASLLRGAGRGWRWVDIGRPGPAAFWPRCVGRVDAGAGEEPWVVAQTADDDWYAWTPGAAGWQRLSGVPAAGYAWSGGAETAGGAAPWLVGLSGERPWTWRPEAEGTNHGSPAAVASVVGTLPVGPGVDHHYVVDSSGRLWERGTFPTWIPHGTPAVDAVVRAPVGAIVTWGVAGRVTSAFVIGTDEHLWERRADPDWRWVDHGSPAGGRIGSTTAPVLASVRGVPRCEVSLVGGDGHLWTRVVDDPPQWRDRGFPQGQLIFGVVGTDVVSRAGTPDMVGVSPVVGEDGHVWVWADLAGWIDLGVPPGGDRAAAGIGARRVARPGGWALQAVVLGSPSGRVSSVVWKSVGATAVEPWQDLGVPPGVQLRGALGVITLLAFDGVRAVVIGDDGAAWTAEAVPGGEPPTWAPWGRPPGAAVTRGVVARSDASRGTVVVVAGTDGHVWSLPDSTVVPVTISGAVRRSDILDRDGYSTYELDRSYAPLVVGGTLSGPGSVIFSVRMPQFVPALPDPKAVAVWVTVNGVEHVDLRNSNWQLASPTWRQVGPVALGPGPFEVGISSGEGDGAGWPDPTEPVVAGDIRVTLDP